MALYSLFSHNVEVQYKSYLLSKAMLFTFITTLLNIILPFIVAYRSRGFWLKSHSFYEQPTVHFTYNYLLIAETDDSSSPIICGDTPLLSQVFNEDHCVELQVEEVDIDTNTKNDVLKFNFKLNIPQDRKIISIILIIALDFELKSTCPLHMQSLALIENTFSHPPSGFKYHADLKFYQISHLPCIRNQIDTKYNNSLLSHKDVDGSIVDYLFEEYFRREVTTQVNKINSRVQYGQTSSLVLEFILRVPEMKVRYVPGLLQEIKWVWPQYLSLVIILYWILNKIKCFVFSNRLVMAWKDTPWKKS